MTKGGSLLASGAGMRECSVEKPAGGGAELERESCDEVEAVSSGREAR